MTPHRILVTGASGFVGRHLTTMLRTAFPNAVVTPSVTSPPLPDIRDPQAVSDLIRALRPDACIHLAAVSAVTAARTDPDRAWSVNLHGTLTLARAILRNAPYCVLLHVSSGEVYGGTPSDGWPLDETAVPRPRTVYAASKAAADLAIGALVSDGLRAIRLRPFNHIGPGQSAAFAVAAFARQIARIEAGLQPPVLTTGALDARRDFLDVRDVCAAYLAALTLADTLSSGTILNIASGTARRIGDVLADLLALAHLDAAIESAPALVRTNETALSLGSADAARLALGWAPRIPWYDTLRDVLDDWRGQTGAAA